VIGKGIVTTGLNRYIIVRITYQSLKFCKFLKGIVMQDPGFSRSEFLADRVAGRQCLFSKRDILSLPGAADGGDRVEFTARDRLDIEFDCSRLDLSRFDRLSARALNHSSSLLLAGVTLYFGQSGKCAAPVSFSGGRERMAAGGRVELLFPRESFGAYGSPDEWRDVRLMVLSFFREKTDLLRGEIRIGLSAVHGERLLALEGPRLTEKGLYRVLREKKNGLAGLEDPPGRGNSPGLGTTHARALRRLAMAVPPPHPYPRESAEEILAGQIMGQKISEPVNWSADPIGIQEWTHFLNRHHFMRTVARRVEETGDERHASFLVRCLRGWIVSSPVPTGSNGGAGPSWETLTAAWRLREWRWVLESLHWVGALEGALRPLVLRSVWEHARSLMDHKGHPNNWIIVESAALALAGMMFPQFIEAPGWVFEGLRRLEAECRKQFFEDGAHFEISPLYHAVSLGACLEVFCAARSCGLSLPQGFGPRIEQRAEYLAALCRPDFTWPSLNDSGGAAEDYTSLMALAGVVFARPDLLWIGTKAAAGRAPGGKFRVFPDAGIAVMRSGFDRNARFMVFRAGPPGAAHIHGDALSVDVAAMGGPQLVDPGITTYAPGPLTDYYRSSASHNNVLIDGRGPSYSRMLFDERVKPAGARLSWDRRGPVESVTGICEGFAGENFGACAAGRTVFFIDGEYWVILDEVNGCGKHDVAVCWQFFPGDVRVDGETGEMRRATNGLSGFLVAPLPGLSKLSMESSTGAGAPPGGWVSLGGSDAPATHVRFSLEAFLPVRLLWLLVPCPEGPASLPRANRRDGAGGVICLEVNFPGGRQDILTFFPHGGVDRGFGSYRCRLMSLRSRNGRTAS
jgi:hypothetical protein